VVGRALGGRKLALHAPVATAPPRDQRPTERQRNHHGGTDPERGAPGRGAGGMNPARRWWEGIWDAGVPSARGSMVRDSGPLARPSPQRRQQFSLYTPRIKTLRGCYRCVSAAALGDASRHAGAPLPAAQTGRGMACGVWRLHRLPHSVPARSATRDQPGPAWTAGLAPDFPRSGGAV
jgi:hypothetical protein